VVVTTYHRPELLAEALASVVAQTVTDLECIVVDDGSGTAAGVVPDDPRVRLVALDRNVGEARARSAGVAAARGEVLCFLDDDDRWEPFRLELAEAALERAPVAICWSRWHDEHDPGGRLLEGWVGDEIVDVVAPSLGATAIRRDRFVGFDTSYAANGDVDLWIRQAAQDPVATTPTVGHVVRRHDGVRHGNDDATRLAASHQLLQVHAAYFRGHRRARAFRTYRIAVLHAEAGRLARSLAWSARSLAARPSARAGAHALRTVRAMARRAGRRRPPTSR
jgi:glycosyltransferase involved in cell wall biosynthesis